MAKGRLNGVLQHLRRVAVLGDGVTLTDGELLECYLTSRDEAAFESLLRRHGPMVLGVCRRVLRNEADAHDAFQATFLVFVRNAVSIVPRARVGNWLYGVAHKTALKAQAMNRQRRSREMQVVAVRQPPATDEALQERLAQLDEALSRLPDKYRTAVVLCDLEEKSLQEAARQLGCPQGTVASRLARARGMLARRLARYGPSVAGGALAAALAQGAPAPLPTPLIVSTARAGTLMAAGPAAAAGVAPPPVAALTEGVLRAMRMTKWKALVAALLAVALLGGGGAVLTYAPLWAGPRGARPESPPPAAGRKDKKPRPDKEALQGTWVVRSAERNGEKFSGEWLNNWGRLVFADDKVTREGRERREGAYTINPDKKPKEIDLFTDGGDTWTGIYELKGATLKMALRCGEERPTDFDPRGALLIIFERK
jgi:RNA polymerase sigma-70 factor (ECF subfamily)